MCCFGDRTNSSRYANQAKSCCFSPKTPKSGVKRTVKGFLRRLSGSKDTQVNIIVRAMEGIVWWPWVSESIVCWLRINMGYVGWPWMKAGFCELARDKSGDVLGRREFVYWPWWGEDVARDERGIVSWPNMKVGIVGLPRIRTRIAGWPVKIFQEGGVCVLAGEEGGNWGLAGEGGGIVG